ncbi:MAG: Grx4 family monothiol glutaredoxin [Pelagibacteraceae bacterium]|jgi:monothiol glutaredoxin|nr:Grx4 family monothiol glutaredoxin [Pelagibacteraceae bacterium]MDP6680729.1 Grx4 family monothiol glutaredoxin [Pelagibacteraceae bacterium]|tara:strand:+ start:688 stop:1026 length:339 start_codon:yes stop_codon:yes gene_type:complete
MNKNLKNKITDIIEKNNVCLFMKGSPDIPQCGFSLAVSNVLKHLEVNFKGINVLEDSELREGIKEYSDWPTIPQLYIKKEFIGGCDIVKEMFENGELHTKLNEKQISFKNEK